MLSAIRDFAADSFGASADESPLEEIEFQGLTLMLAQGPEAVLALVVRGNPPRTLHERAVATIEALHVEYGAEMNEFNGEAETVAPLRPLLEDLLEKEDRRREPNRLIRLVPKVLALALVGWTLFSGTQAYLSNRDLGRVESALRRAPGVIVTSATVDSGTIVIEGLADPLVKEPRRIARAALGDSERRVELLLRPFTSLDEAIVVQRLRRLVSIPASVGLEVRSGVVRVSGLDAGACEATGAALRELRLELLGIESVIVRP